MYKRRQLMPPTRRTVLIGLKDNECFGCHNTYPHYMYDFHHVDPSTKKFKLSGNGLNRKWDLVLEEIEKCVMLCPNCHRIAHYKLSNEQ